MKTNKTTDYWNPLGTAKAVLRDKFRDLNTHIKIKVISNNPMMYSTS